METMERVDKALEEAHRELTAIIERQREQQAVDEEIGKARTTLEECIAELRNDAKRFEQTAASLRRGIETLEQAARILKDAQLEKVREDIGNAHTTLAEQIRRSRTVSWICTAISLTSLAAVGVVLYQMMNQQNQRPAPAERVAGRVAGVARLIAIARGDVSLVRRQGSPIRESIGLTVPSAGGQGRCAQPTDLPHSGRSRARDAERVPRIRCGQGASGAWRCPRGVCTTSLPGSPCIMAAIAAPTNSRASRTGLPTERM